MPSGIQLQGFRRSRTKGKKYDAVLYNIDTGDTKYVPFGDVNYQQYKDTTGLGLYSHLDHNDKKRRANYLARHAKTRTKLWSPSYFAATYLW